MVSLPTETTLEKTNFFLFMSGCKLKIVSELGMGPGVSFFSHCCDPHMAWTNPGPVRAATVSACSHMHHSCYI